MACISIIAALAENNAIGKGNDLLFHIPGDLKRFKEITTGHSVIMGRKTYLSLPKRPLPNRHNIVITKDENARFEGCSVVKSIQEAIDLVTGEKEAFVIGGGEIYKQFLPIADKLYLTHSEKLVDDADVFFPQINFDDWLSISRESYAAGVKADFAFSYVNYVRK